MEIEIKDMKRADRRAKSFAKYNARLKGYKEAGLLEGYDDTKSQRFVAKNSLAYHGWLVSKGWGNTRYQGHPRAWGDGDAKKVIREALAFA